MKFTIALLSVILIFGCSNKSLEENCEGELYEVTYVETYNCEHCEDLGLKLKEIINIIKEKDVICFTDSKFTIYNSSELVIGQADFNKQTLMINIQNDYGSMSQENDSTLILEYVSPMTLNEDINGMQNEDLIKLVRINNK